MRRAECFSRDSLPSLTKKAMKEYYFTFNLIYVSLSLSQTHTHKHALSISFTTPLSLSHTNTRTHTLSHFSRASKSHSNNLLLSG